MNTPITSLIDVVQNGMCIGCGLCESVSQGSVKMTLTEYGSLRPIHLHMLSTAQQDILLQTCPGISVEPRTDSDSRSEAHHDLIWGQYYRMQFAWSSDAEIRFRAASGGVLTSLAIHLLAQNRASFILHVGADPQHPLRNRWQLSETRQQVIENSNSRYAPTSPLAGLIPALDREQSFAIIAKPCDLNALHRYAKIDPRVDRYCVARLAMVCGGQSRMTKSWQVLKQMNIDENEVSLFRYRGYGNPGRIRVETRDGRAQEQSYMSFWEDESQWDVETRCKFCPDALGEAADIAAADVWAGGNPVGEDDGFNAVITHSSQGETLFEEAVTQGTLVAGDQISIEQMNDFQPHQVRKKQALAARYAGLKDAGLPAIETPGYRIEALGQALSAEDFARQRAGVMKRVSEGKVRELHRGD